MADIIPNKLATVSDVESMSSSFDPGSLLVSDYITKQDVIGNLSNGFDLNNKNNYDDNQLVKLEDVKYGLIKSTKLRLRLAALFAVRYPNSVDTNFKLTIYEGSCIGPGGVVRDERYWAEKGSISHRRSDGSGILFTNYIGEEMDYKADIGENDIILKLESDSNEEATVSDSIPFAFGINEFRGNVINTISTQLGNVISTETISIGDNYFNFESEGNTFDADDIYFGDAYLTGVKNRKLITSWLNFDNYPLLSTNKLTREGNMNLLVGSTPYSTYINRRGVFFINSSSYSLKYDKDDKSYFNTNAFKVGQLNIANNGFSSIEKNVFIVFKIPN